MKKGSLLKYKIGVGLIGLFVVILLVIVIGQASATKQDANTYNSAVNIADKLNNYMDSSLIAPSTLSEAGINNVPSSVTYQKLSDNSYKFCVNYKSKSSDFNASDVETNLITDAVGGSGSSTQTDNSFLTIDTTHHKGDNCQTITTFSNADTELFNSSSQDESGSTDNSQSN